jgi:hypothetical protein
MNAEQKKPSAPRSGGCCGHSQDHSSGATVSKTTSAPAGVAKPGDKEPEARGAAVEPSRDHGH